MIRVLALLATLAAPQGLPAPKPITVSAAVSLTDVLTAIAGQYGKDGHGSVRFNFGASNVLARQITSGAPVDLFISADEAQMDVVAAAGLVAEARASICCATSWRSSCRTTGRGR